MQVAFRSDIGQKRKNNEDTILVEQEGGIFILADGMGGHQAGEIASEIAVQEVYKYLKERIKYTVIASGEKISAALREALLVAHDVVREKAKADINLVGMGTTLVEMVIRNGKAFICHVGDSRAYLLREGIFRITKDHTVGDYLVEHKLLKREDVSPQNWHTLTQAVGVSENLKPDLNQVELKEGDHLLLCSDGLSDMLPDEEIFDIVNGDEKAPEKIVTSLIEEANRKGGKDNISVVLVKV